MTNIVNFKKPKKADSDSRHKTPFINLPFVTKLLLIIIIGIYALTGFLLPNDVVVDIILSYGYIPARLIEPSLFPFDLGTIFSPLTYIFLHGGLMHVIMNSAMLMAFGSGVEQWLGRKKFLLFFFGCGVAAVAVETLIHPTSINPVIGASGALSGLFAAILILMQQRGQLPTRRYGIWPFALFWVGISLLFSIVGGSMAGGQIAWAAHLGGFLAGFGLLKLKYFNII
jgi:membrane associated rhomboid family serine protease